METKNIIQELRIKHGMSQEELAGKIFVTRQAVSRWETGETVPNTETLKLLSEFFDVSINTLLGAPRKLICQCCGMPLDDSIISHEADGTLNEDYCKYCYEDGHFAQDCTMEEMIDFCAQYVDEFNKGKPKLLTVEEYKDMMRGFFPLLKRWKRLAPTALSRLKKARLPKPSARL